MKCVRFRQKTVLKCRVFWPEFHQFFKKCWIPVRMCTFAMHSIPTNVFNSSRCALAMHSIPTNIFNSSPCALAMRSIPTNVFDSRTFLAVMYSILINAFNSIQIPMVIVSPKTKKHNGCLHIFGKESDGDINQCDIPIVVVYMCTFLEKGRFVTDNIDISAVFDFCV